MTHLKSHIHKNASVTAFNPHKSTCLILTSPHVPNCRYSIEAGRTTSDDPFEGDDRPKPWPVILVCLARNLPNPFTTNDKPVKITKTIMPRGLPSIFF